MPPESCYSCDVAPRRGPSTALAPPSRLESCLLSPQSQSLPLRAVKRHATSEARASLPETYASKIVRREVYEVAEWLQPFNTGPKRKTYARTSEGAEGANALGLKGAKPVQRDIFGFRKTGPRAIARGRGGD